MECCDWMMPRDTTGWDWWPSRLICATLLPATAPPPPSPALLPRPFSSSVSLSVVSRTCALQSGSCALPVRKLRRGCAGCLRRCRIDRLSGWKHGNKSAGKSRRIYPASPRIPPPGSCIRRSFKDHYFPPLLLLLLLLHERAHKDKFQPDPP